MQLLGNSNIIVLVIAFYARLSFGSWWLGWNNQYDQELNFVCQRDKAVISISSRHDNGPEDRMFSIGCRATIGTKQNCYWSGWVNSYDEFFAYQCRNNGFIHGMRSIHDNGKEDRVWQFYCCERKGYTVSECYNTRHTDWDASFVITVPNGKVMRGVTSVHSNFYEDRMYSFNICKLKPSCH